MCRDYSRLSPSTTGIACLFVLLLLANSCFVCLPVIGRGTVIKHVDMDELKKYEDTLSETDFQSLMERARSIESMIQSGGVKTLDAREYTQAIDSVKQEASVKAEQRKGELEQNTRTVNSEFNRVGNTLDSYGKDLSKEQSKEIEEKVTELSKRWTEGEGQRSVNQGINDCAEMMTELKKIHDGIMDASMSRKPKSPEGEKKDDFIRGGLDPRSDDAKEEAESGFGIGRAPQVDDPQQAQKSRWVPGELRIQPSPPPEPTYKMLQDLQKRLDALKTIHSIGTFELESFYSELESLKEFSRKAIRPADEKIVRDRINSLQSAIHKALRGK